MNNAYVATFLAKALLAEKKERLNTRVDEIAAEKGMSILERHKFRRAFLLRGHASRRRIQSPSCA